MHGGGGGGAGVGGGPGGGAGGGAPGGAHLAAGPGGEEEVGQQGAGPQGAVEGGDARQEGPEHQHNVDVPDRGGCHDNDPSINSQTHTHFCTLYTQHVHTTSNGETYCCRVDGWEKHNLVKEY